MGAKGIIDKPIKKKNSIFNSSLRKGMGSGRETDYNEDLAKRICDEIACCTDSLKTICERNADFPHYKTIYIWRAKHADFRNALLEARRHQADLLAAEVIEIADASNNDTKITAGGHEVMNTEWVARSRLRIDTRKWLATTLLPRVYGNKIEELETENAELKQQMNELKAQLDEKYKKDY